MPILNTEYRPHLSTGHNVTSTKKKAREWTILQGTFHTAAWTVIKDSKGNNTTADIKAAPFH